ncbi:adenosylmethionine decarboxylase [Catellatospora coxensis]|uniref:S-adenosylmethionine decarboxylase proenzyme n=1 Tax=Catellatospora coxensis TaxID=310354 RepID=A0A8J3L4J6_9ACTN|nr:S-adenosylmethionine decarboxylase proenzyme [Catellatospora coxensis]
MSHQLSAVIATRPDLDDSPEYLIGILRSAALAAELTPMGHTSVRFQPCGSSAVVLLAESHIAAHHWPEHHKMTVDIHICDYRRDNLSSAQRAAKSIEKAVATKTPTWRLRSIAG